MQGLSWTWPSVLKPRLLITWVSLGAHRPGPACFLVGSMPKTLKQKLEGLIKSPKFSSFFLKRPYPHLQYTLAWHSLRNVVHSFHSWFLKGLNFLPWISSSFGESWDCDGDDDDDDDFWQHNGKLTSLAPPSCSPWCIIHCWSFIILGISILSIIKAVLLFLQHN